MRHRTRAQVVVWVAVLLPTMFLPVLGLSIDAGVMFDARRELQNAADGAARVGAMEIARPLGSLGEIRLDEGRARAAVDDYFRDRVSVPMSHDTDITGNRVTVTVHRTLRLPFLRLLHVPNPRIGTAGSARPCSGVTEGTATCE